MFTLTLVSLLQSSVPDAAPVVDTRDVIIVSSLVRCERRELIQGSGTVRICEYTRGGK